MYPKDCCKIQPPYVINIPTYCNHIMHSYHYIMASFHSAMNLIILHIISLRLTPCRLHGYCFLQLSPATSIGKLIYLKYDKKKINLKLNKIKIIPQ